MTFKGYKIHVILLAFAVVLAVGFGAQKLVFSRHAAESLERDFTALAGVTAVEIDEANGKTDIFLRVDDRIDFPSVYKEARQLATKRFGDPGVTVVLVDDRTDGLQSAYDRIHLALYEGAATGRFVHMKERIDRALQTRDGDAIVYHVTVDEEAVYVVLSDGEGRLFERIPRRPKGEAGTGGMIP